MFPALQLHILLPQPQWPRDLRRKFLDVHLFRTPRHGLPDNHSRRSLHLCKTSKLPPYIRSPLHRRRTSLSPRLPISLRRSSRLISLLLAFLHPLSIQHLGRRNSRKRRFRRHGFFHHPLNARTLARLGTKCIPNHPPIFPRN